MSSECTFYITPTQNILQLHGILKQHVTIYSPPYSIRNILEAFVAPRGRQIRVVIDHRNRDVQIVESSITHHILQTTIGAFQSHRLAAVPQTHSLDQRFSQLTTSSEPGRTTQQECPICFEKICENNGSALPCMHTFHTRCIRPWLMENNTCPVCRHAV